MNLRVIAQNSAWIGLVQILNLAIPILTVPIVSRAFGPTTYGAIASLSAIAGYAGLVITFGFHLSGPRLIARTPTQPHLLSRAFSTIYMGQIVLAVIAAIPLLFVLPLLGFDRSNGLLGLVILGSVIFTALTPMWMFIGLQSVRAIALSQFSLRVCGALLVVMLVRHESDALLYVTINAIIAVVGCAWSFVVLRRRGVTLAWVAASDVKNAIQGAARLFVSSVAINLYTTTNIVVVGFMLGPTAAGYFALADRVRGAAIGLFEPVSQSLYPYLCGNAPEGGDGNGEAVRADNRRTFFRAIIALSVVASAVLYAGSPFVATFLGGERFAKSVPLLQILSVTPLLICLSSLLGIQTMLPANLERELSRIVVAAGLCGVPLAVLSTSLMGLEGVAWSYVMVELGVLLAMAATVGRRQSIRELLFRPPAPRSGAASA